MYKINKNMKLLLTSSGITNKSIADALFEMVGKKPENIKLVFIPTASNMEEGDKEWVTNDLLNLKKLNLNLIEIVDISVMDEKIWKPIIEKADVLFFEGGNTYFLMEWLNKSGLAKMLPELLKNKVYVGVSAGSMVVSKDLALDISQKIYEEDLDKDYEMAGLNYVDFYFLPHLNSAYFTKAREDVIKNTVKKIREKIYVMDDESALKIIDNKIEVVSEGECFEIN